MQFLFLGNSGLKLQKWFKPEMTVNAEKGRYIHKYQSEVVGGKR